MLSDLQQRKVSLAKGIIEIANEIANVIANVITELYYNKRNVYGSRSTKLPF